MPGNAVSPVVGKYKRVDCHNGKKELLSIGKQP
jgi:hypothetical protein